MSKPNAIPWPRCDFSGVTDLGPCPCCGGEIGTVGWDWAGLLWCSWCLWHPNEAHPKAIRVEETGA